MKKLSLLALLVVVFMLVGSTVASADVKWVFGYRNNTSVNVNDLHVRVFSDASMTIPLNVSTATALDPPGWAVDGIAANQIDMSGPNIAPGGIVIFSFETTGGPGTRIWTNGEWTFDGGYVGDADDWDVLESNVIQDVKAVIPRSIKLTLSSYDVDFGFIRPGKKYSRTLEATVTSNSNWDLYVGGNDIAPFRSLLEPSLLSIRTSLNAGQVFGLPAPGQTVQVLGNRDWQVDSFFDITYEIDLTGGTNPNPGVYRARINLNAVQNY